MKKIYFAILLIFGYNLVLYSQLPDPCTQCPQPNICSTFNITVNCPFVPDCEVERNVTVTICYFCPVTHMGIDFKIVAIRSLREIKGCGCIEVVWDAIQEYITEHLMEFCGNIPCSQGYRSFKIYYPVCADLFIRGPDNDYEYFLTANPSCYVFCYREFLWCWDENLGRMRIEEVGEPTLTANINCTYQEPPPFNPLNPFHWRHVSCELIKSPCNNEGWEPK